MKTIFKRALGKLLRLSAEGLSGYCTRFRCELGSAEWNMGLGLLALKRTSAFRQLGYSTLTDFAERVLEPVRAKGVRIARGRGGSGTSSFTIRGL